MKKILLAGALAASMLASSAAFAADLTVDVSENKLTVTADTDAIMAANAGKQMTVVVVDGDGTTVSTDTIRYIDQDEAKAGLFESMGVLLREEETALPDGTYTVKIGGEDITDLYVGTLTIAAEPEGTKVTLYVGDVNNDKMADTTDGMAIISRATGGPDKITNAVYNIGELVGDVYVGDVNNDKMADTTDGMAIISRATGGPDKITNAIYNIGEAVEVTVK